MTTAFQAPPRDPVGVELDLRALGRALWAKRFLILFLTILAAVLAYVAVNLVTPRFTAETRLLIDTRESVFLRPDADRAPDRSAADAEAISSQVQLIQSRDLALQVIKKLNLGDLPEFDPMLGGGSSPLRVILSLFGIGKDPIATAPEERVLRSYFGRLTVYAVEKSRVIAIEFVSSDPVLAARVANTIAESYLSLQQQSKQDQNRSAAQWLEREIDNLRPKVTEAEAKVEEFRSNTNLILGTNSTTLSNQQLGDYNSQLAAARAQRAEAEGKARLIREALRAGRSTEFNDILNSDVMRRLSEQRVTLNTQLAEQSTTLLSLHPRIRELNAQIADLDRQMRLEAERQARALENEARVAGARVESLSAGLDQLKRQAAATGTQDVQLRGLEREAKAQRDLLESYLAKYREAVGRDNLEATPADARIVSRATVADTPSWPKKLPIVMISALTVFVLTVAFIVTGQLLGAGSPVAAAPVVAAAPAVEARPRRRLFGLERWLPARAQKAAPAEPLVSAKPLATPANADLVQMLANEMRQAVPAVQGITVLAASPDDDAATTALALAREMSEDERVILVKLDQGSPVSDGEQRTPGLADLMRGEASFGDIITRDPQSNAHIIVGGRASTEPMSVFASRRVITTLEALMLAYDKVVLDASGVAETITTQYAQVAPHVVLVVSEAAQSDAAEISEKLLNEGFAAVTVIAQSPPAPAVKEAA